MWKSLQLSPWLVSALLFVCPCTSRANDLPEVFHDAVDMTVPGYVSGSNVVADFPLRVEVGPDRPNGFDPGLAGASGANLRFCYKIDSYEEGGVQKAFTNWVNCVVSNWNARANSTVYVALPRLNNNATARLTMHWNAYGVDLPANDPDAVPAPDGEGRSEAWRRNLEAQATNALNYVAVGEATRDDRLLNYWVTPPSLSKASWTEGEKGAVASLGVAKSGYASLKYLNLSSLKETEEMPTRQGSYEARFTVAKGETYSELAYAVGFTIEAGQAVEGVAGATDWRFRSVIKVPGYTGDEQLKNFPLAVRLAQGKPKGFSYESFPFGADTAEQAYSDMRFYDQSGKALNYEIDTWRPGGESVVWVSVPALSTASEITLCWGLAAGLALPENAPASVWRDYVGVWHMDSPRDASPNAAAGEFGPNAVAQPNGAFGAAYGTQKTGINDAILKAGRTSALSKLSETGFTASFWMYLRDGTWAYPFARKNHDRYAGWGLQFCGPTGVEGNLNGLKLHYGIQEVGTKEQCIIRTDSRFVTNSRWQKVDVVMLPKRCQVWVDGVLVGEADSAYALRDGDLGLAIGGMWGTEADGHGTLNGDIDEFRIRAGGDLSAARAAADYAQYTNAAFVSYAPVSEDTAKQLQNRWRREPSFSKASWAKDEAPATYDLGETFGGVPTVAWYNRLTGEKLAAMPTDAVGEYRAVFTFAETPKWSKLEKILSFSINRNSGTHDLGAGSDRALLANDDFSVDGGRVDYQSYDNNEAGWGVPYWKHLNAAGEKADSGDDYTSESTWFNFFAGTHHEYWSADGASKLWGLLNVRIGNTFDNAWWHPDQTGTNGLSPKRNYLPWNAASERMVLSHYPVGEFHEYAGTLVLRNVATPGGEAQRPANVAAICSPCYADGIGTVYFDAVNGGADNATNGYYKLVLEMATSATDLNGTPTGEAPTDDRIASKDGEDRTGYGDFDAYRYANWQRVEMHVLRVNGGQTADLGVTDELTLDVEAGGSCTNFYRVYAPVNREEPCRFRIRRTAVDPDYVLDPDAGALILVDNVIASRSGEKVRLEPYGWDDARKTGKQYLGREGAFTPAFPGLGDSVLPRVRTISREGTNVAGSVTAVTMHYRWSYLAQQVSEWLYVDIDPATLKADRPLSLPAYPGDVEFGFEGVKSEGGRYVYADYSGTGVGVPGYAEPGARVEGGWNEADRAGAWSFRIREGSSAYEAIELLCRTTDAEGAVRVATNRMFVTADNTWRGYCQTTNGCPDAVEVRVVFLNCQDAGADDWSWNTNVCAFTESVVELPYSGRLSSVGTETWAKIPVDAKTGYLMFQLEDSSMGMTVMHADYQNFNAWNDAHGDVFVGSSLDDSLPQTGTSPLAKEHRVTYADYADTEATNTLWSTDFNGLTEAPFDTTFGPGQQTSHQWQLGKGKFVSGNYQDSEVRGVKSYAFQMAGSGEGYAQLVDPQKKPRGLESVSFNARVAQTLDFGDISHNLTGYSKTDYTFLTRAAFDLKGNRGFTGAASLSLVGYYHPTFGCYEVRLEQVRGEYDQQGTLVGPTRTGQRMSIYRWRPSASGGYVATRVHSYDNGFGVAMPEATAAETNLLAFAMSVYCTNDATYVMAAVNKRALKAEDTLRADDNWNFVTYKDTSADRLTAGSFGVVSANCEGLFVRPQTADKPLVMHNVAANAVVTGNYSNKQINLGNEDFREGWQDLKDNLWAVQPGRTVPFGVSPRQANDYGFVAASVTQSVDVVALAANESDWNKAVILGSVPVTGFGTAGVKVEFDPHFWYAKDCKVRLRTGGTLDDRRTDVTIDNIVLRQWRGENEPVIDAKAYSAPNDVVYTSGWITNGAVQLSARRTDLALAPASIRSPAFDGLDGRGLGLGSVSFRCRNVQEGVRILVQVATNVTYASLPELTTAGTNNVRWVTERVLEYDDLAGHEGGPVVCTFGLHGVKGVVRLLLDPALTEEAAQAETPSGFRSVDISDVVFKDEPDIDSVSCWWGWNLRTVGDGLDSEKRMYLPDGRELGGGMSLALNNSVTEDVDPAKAAEGVYGNHMPFVQSPTFAESIVGEISFKARKYDNARSSAAAEVALYGAKSGVTLDSDKDWVLLKTFEVSDTVYANCSFQTDPGENYKAFRLAVTGVTGVTYPGPKPAGGEPVRVLIDEITVSEAVRARLAFRNVGAFRSDLSGTAAVPNVLDRSEQPLCGEGWGVQAELYAIMMADQIDRTREPRVRLWWYEGSAPWGFENWKSLAGARSGWMAKASDTNMVYRSSYLSAPDAVVPQVETAPTVVQYMLEARYYIVDSKTGASKETVTYLSVPEGEWKRPSWYAPVDYNADPAYGAGRASSCYNILDTLAPGWAWINEVNVYGVYDGYFRDSDQNCQFVEIAAPAAQDMSGWQVRMLGVQTGDVPEVCTNTVATFGYNSLSGTKEKNVTSNYVFHVIGNPDQGTGGRDIFSRTQGTYDGAWVFENAAVGSEPFESNGTVMQYVPFGIQLVRPSGIVESEVVVLGTNFWNGVYSPEWTVQTLNASGATRGFYFVGSDNTAASNSVGVFRGQARAASDWNAAMVRTPGKINEGQQIDELVPAPQGEFVMVYARLDESKGPIRQTCGEVANTNLTQTLVIRRGSETGTNITYFVDNWYEVGAVTETSRDGQVVHTPDPSSRTWTVTVAKGASNNVTVVAQAAADAQLREYGLDDGNRYTPAVLDWLNKGTTKRGAFANDDGVLRPAQLCDQTGAYIRDMSATEMYWLDIDPTVGDDLAFWSGFSKPPQPKSVTVGGQPMTNLTLGVFMMITNAAEGTAWSPYTCRGLAPDSSSDAYVPGAGENWTSVTFKVKGCLQTGLTSTNGVASSWLSLRWFVFGSDSFWQPADELLDPAHKAFSADIEVKDPWHNTESPGYGAGWQEWMSRNGWRQIFWSWGLDDGRLPFEVEVLKKDSLYGE